MKKKNSLVDNGNLYRKLSEVTFDGIVVHENGRIIEVSEKFAQLFGYEAAELIGKDGFNLVPAECRHALRERILSGDLRPYETVGLRKNGTTLSIEVHATNIEQQQRQLRLVAVRDITVRKRAEEELKEKNIALSELIGQIEMEKKKLKDNVVANVSKLILPSLKKMRMKGASRKYVSMVQNQLEQLLSSYGRIITQQNIRFSPREFEVCNMVKSGLTSKEISGLLAISPQTVDKHRKNIRKKLSITDREINLASYFHSLEL